MIRAIPLMILGLSACGGIGAGGGINPADLPSPLQGTARCVDAVASETGRNRRGIVVMQAATADTPTALLQVAGAEAPWTCQVNRDGQVASLVAPSA